VALLVISHAEKVKMYFQMRRLALNSASVAEKATCLLFFFACFPTLFCCSRFLLFQGSLQRERSR
jgi:hypothetical protein